MNYQTHTNLAQITAKQAAARLGCDYYDLDYYAWPQTFGSTTGPFGGIGGQSMTTFTIEAWTNGDDAVLFCGNRIWKVVHRFIPMGRY